MRPPASSSRAAPGRAILRMLLNRCDGAEISDRLRSVLVIETTPREEIEALLSRLVAEQVLDRVSARAVSLILAGRLDPQDLKQLLPPRKVRARRPEGDPGQAEPTANLLSEGTRVGPCIVGELLYSGPNGNLYRARHAGLGCPLVVKVAAPGRASEQLRNETAALTAITHRNVVRLWDAGTVGSLPYLATECLAASCQQLLGREKRLAPERTFRLARDFARGLRAALRAGFTHGDVKPGNLLVDSHDQGKVADFGLARRTGDVACRPLEPLAGTWQYAAPERFAGYADHRADIYSLALSLYHLLTGVPPVAGRTHRDCLKAHRELVLEPLHWILPGVPREASALLLRMAARDPDQRPTDYDEVIDRLGQVVTRTVAVAGNVPVASREASARAQPDHGQTQPDHGRTQPDHGQDPGDVE